MKVAVLIPGELRAVYNVKNLYNGCDVFIHSDKKFLDTIPCHKFQVFNEEDEKLSKKYLDNHIVNFHRIVQWFRYRELLKNDFSDYDIVVKTRTDLGCSIDTLMGFLKDKKVEDNTLYMRSDWMWYGTPEIILKTDFYRHIIFCVHGDRKYFQLDYDTILKSELDCARFAWLNYPKQYINNWKTIREDIEKNIDRLKGIKSNSIGPDEIYTEFPIEISTPFPSEKFFLMYLINQGIVCKTVDFPVCVDAVRKLL
jgi:hypothetical protein|tara:strand:- start:22 stop:783 length:762 start_codon:yes stop_codon:yes gene_type:complete